MLRFTTMNILVTLITAFVLVVPFQAQAREDAPRVVASIAPVHGLLSLVMAGVGEPELLMPGSVSPHAYSLKPSHALTLERADAVFWIGPAMEGALAKPITTLSTSAEVVEFMVQPGLILLPRREGGLLKDEHGDEHANEHGAETADEHAGHDDHGDIDPHIWLDPRNGAVMLQMMAATLGAIDPVNAARYQANADGAVRDIEQLSADVLDVLSTVHDLPFVVFHDAYQYFEQRFATHPAAIISIDPERAVGARRIREFRAAIRTRNIRCVFTEPQFEPKLADILVEGSGARLGTLDPLGGSIALGADFYATLLRNMAHDHATCLDDGS